MKAFGKLTRWAHPLMVFQATARHRSVRVAAGELDMSPRNVSRSLREFEAAMGIKLFTRGHGRIGLTQAGEILYLALSTGFDDMREAASRLHPAMPVEADDGSHISAACLCRTGASASRPQ